MYSSPLFLRRLQIVAVILFCLTTAQLTPAEAETTATGVVERYLAALFTGDVATIQACLDDTMQARRKNTLQDPSYPAFLRERYNGATYRVIDTATQTSGTTVVDVQITDRTNSAVVVRLILNRRHRIIDEISL